MSFFFFFSLCANRQKRNHALRREQDTLESDTKNLHIAVRNMKAHDIYQQSSANNKRKF